MWEPVNGTLTERKLHSDTSRKLFERLSTHTMILAFNKAVKHEGVKEFDRNVSALLFSIASYAVKSKNEKLAESKTSKQRGLLSEKRYQTIEEMSLEYQNSIDKLKKTAYKIIKDDAKELSEDCGVPANICAWALMGSPDIEFITRFSLNFYFSNTLAMIYEQIYSGGYLTNITPKMWKKFFEGVYGEDKVVECATLIALEGMSRYERYKDSEDVKKVWDSLTEFALNCLENAPERIREQMMDIYVKKIEKMFKNNSFELRVDMRNLSKIDYPKLVETTAKYAQTITDIINKVTK